MQSSAAKCFLFTAAVFLLQLFPLTGMLLMILAAPFWSVITINLGFILVIADVVAGTLPRWALALPVIYFWRLLRYSGRESFRGTKPCQRHIG